MRTFLNFWNLKPSRQLKFMKFSRALTRAGSDDEGTFNRLTRQIGRDDVVNFATCSRVYPQLRYLYRHFECENCCMGFASFLNIGAYVSYRNHK
jgi:hypothetical protein